VQADDLELVALVSHDIGNEKLPDAAFVASPHGVAPSVPAVEVADHAHPAGIGGPHGEEKALNAAEVEKMGTELAIDRIAGGVADPREIVMREKGAEAVGIVMDLGPVLLFDAQPVIGPLGGAERADEIALRQPSLHAAENRLSVATHQGDGIGIRPDDADLPPAGSNLVRAEHGEGIAGIDDLGNRRRLGRALACALRSTTVLIHSGNPFHISVP